MKLRLVIYLLVGIPALIFNPLWDDGPDYGRSAQQIRVALDGVWKVSAGGKTSTFRIDFGKHHKTSTSFIRTASACSHRSLVSSAEACADVTEMKLKLIAIDGALPTDAMFETFSVEFHGGRLHLTLDGQLVEASVEANGDVQPIHEPGMSIVHTRS